MSQDADLTRELVAKIQQFFGHQIESNNDLSEANKDSLTAATECVEQAYNVPRQMASSSLLDIYRSHLLASAALASSANNPANIGQSQAQVQGQQTQEQQQQASKQHSQHPISQLPMTTRKKLSHLRAQIKRQASKAARSRLEKRSSVSVVATGSGSTGRSFGASHLSGFLGASLDSGGGSNSKKQQEHHHHQQQQHLQHQAIDAAHSKESSSQQQNSSSLDSPSFSNNNNNINNNNQSTSSPAGSNNGPSAVSSNNAGQNDPSLNLSSTFGGQHNESAGGSSGNKHSGQAIPGTHHHSIGVSVHQKNFKQKLIALIKKFRTDGSDFDSEEQYREALERELMKAAAGRGSRAIEELLEEDIDVEEESGSEPDDSDNISESSTPKPSLRPFFSSTTLDKI